jgi:hypothetical protein
MSEFERSENAEREPFNYDVFNKKLSDFVKFAIEDGIDVGDDEMPAEGKEGQSLKESLDIATKGLSISERLLEQTAQDALDRGDTEIAEIFSRNANKLRNIIDSNSDNEQNKK